jgi:SAM-dependent methyltransferase
MKMDAAPSTGTMCGVAHRQTPPRGEQYWSDVSRNFNHHYLDDFMGKMKREAYLALIRQWGGVPAGGRVLKTDLFEEATGPDLFLDALTDDAEMAIGMDLSVDLTSRARRRVANARFIAASSVALPFADQSLDLIISPSTLDHFDNPEDLGRSLRELLRVLRPDGRLIVALDNRQNITDWLLRLAKKLGWIPYFLGRSYSAKELRRELEDAGFEVCETDTILHNPRLLALGAVTVAQKLRFRSLGWLVQKWLMAMQWFGKTPLRYRTGSFVAALAVRPKKSP